MNIDTTIAQFELQTSWLLNSLENISEKESNLRHDENMNSIKWLAGHLINSRTSVWTILTGNAGSEEYKQLFGKGSSGELTANAPNIEQLRQDWLEISQKLKVALENTTEEKLNSTAPFQTSIPNGTLYGLIAFFVIHEGFHIGQISILRKLLGKESMTLGLKR